MSSSCCFRLRIALCCLLLFLLIGAVVGASSPQDSPFPVASPAPEPPSSIAAPRSRAPDYDVVAPYPWYRWQGEQSSGACANGNANCGPTSVAMAIQFAKKQVVPVSAIRTYVGGACSQNTGLAQLESALTKWGVSYSEITGWDEVVRAVNERHHIVIVPARMSEVPDGADFNQGYTDPGGHYNRYIGVGDHILVVKGFSSDMQWVITYDPYAFERNVYWYSNGYPKGFDRYYAYGAFSSAFTSLLNQAVEITQAAADENIAGSVVYADSDASVAGATVVLSSGPSAGSVTRSGEGGAFSFSALYDDPPIVTAIEGNQIDAQRISVAGASSTLRIASTYSPKIVLPVDGKVEVTFVSTGAPGDQTGCTGDFGLQTPQGEAVFPDYLFYRGVPFTLPDVLAKGTELVFYLTPHSFCEGPTFLSTDATRAVVDQPDANTWMLGWEDWTDGDFNDLVVRITVHAAKNPWLYPPFGSASAAAAGAGALPPVEGLMDHRYPLSASSPDAYPYAVTYRGDDSIESGPGGAATQANNGNDGTDFRLAEGTVIAAAGDGVVTFAGWAPRTCAATGQSVSGRAVKIRHDNGWTTEYWWLNGLAPAATVGSQVGAQAVIGWNGVNPCRGTAGLHFVLRNAEGVPIDPFGWQPRPDSFWAGLRDPWEEYNAALGRDGTSYPLWSVPTETRTLVQPSEPTVIVVPSGAVRVTVPAEAYGAPLRMELAEQWAASQVLDTRTLKDFTVFAYTVEDRPVTALERELDLEVQLGQRLSIRSPQPILYLWDVGSDSGSGWRQMPSTWDAEHGLLSAKVADMGAYAVTVGLGQVYLPTLFR